MCLDSQWLQVLQPENEEDRFRFEILPSTAVRLANALWFGLSGPIWNTEEWTAVDKINCATLGHVGDEATKKRWRSQRFPGKIYGSVWSHFNCAVNIKLCLNPVWQFNTLPLSQPGAGHQLTHDSQLQSLLWTVTDWIETPHRGAQCSKGSGGRSTGPPLKCTRNVFSMQVGVYIYITPRIQDQDQRRTSQASAPGHDSRSLRPHGMKEECLRFVCSQRNTGDWPKV